MRFYVRITGGLGTYFFKKFCTLRREKNLKLQNDTEDKSYNPENVCKYQALCGVVRYNIFFRDTSRAKRIWR